MMVGAQLAMVSRENRRAVESARETGLCVVQRAVRVVHPSDWEDDGDEPQLGQAEERDRRSGEWRALGSPRENLLREGQSCTAVGNLVYMIGGECYSDDDGYV